MNLDKISRALRDLSHEGIDVSALQEQIRSAQAAREREVPTEDDTAWPLLTPCTIEEHLNYGRTKKVIKTENGSFVEVLEGEGRRPDFGCAIAKGRMYTLTIAQRQILKEWFNMIPSPEIEVLEVALYPGAIAFAREVVIKTTPHVTHGKVLNGPRVITLSRFGAFMQACCVREKELAQQAEIATLTKRVEKLLKRAREKSIPHDVRSPGAIAWPWHSECEQKKLVDPQEVRDELRTILISKGEPQLAELVKEPFFLGDDGEKKTTKREEEFAGFLAALGLPAE